MNELRIMQGQMIDAFQRGWHLRAETLRRQIITYINDLNHDPADPVVMRTDEKQEAEDMYEKDGYHLIR